MSCSLIQVEMNQYKVLAVGFWCMTTALVTGTIESTPAHTDGVLTTCAGNQISITCTHSNLDSGITRWNFSLPINCVVIVAHTNPSSTEPCGPFTFQDITPYAPDVILSSTAVAIATTSMTGTTVECRDSSGLKYTIIGPITLCIIGDMLSLSVTDTIGGVLIEWQLTTSEYCQGHINYTVIIDTADHLSSIFTWVTTFGVNRTTVPGLIPNQVYTVKVSAAVASSCDNITATRNFTKGGNSSRENPADNNSDGGSNLLVIPFVVCAAIIVFVIFVIVVVTTVVDMKYYCNKGTATNVQNDSSWHEPESVVNTRRLSENPAETEEDNVVYYSTIKSHDLNDMEMKPNQVYGVTTDSTCIVTQPNLVYEQPYQEAAIICSR